EACSRVRSVGSFRCLKTGWCTEVELEPVTGRTHQLRRHLLALGHPVLGDSRYVDGPVYRGNGLFLASVLLDLPALDSDGRVVVQAPLPAKFSSFRRREERRWSRWHSEG
ncbi:MAG: hypothetical protein KC656_35530, partial [Myxococcales bacterium]|nr:hypothetical protein [Myxococcales bacterium]